MFFSAQLCKLPPQCWYFDWQFALSNLQPARTTCSRKLQICSCRFLGRFLFKLNISLGTLLSWFLVHADDNWGRSDRRKCLNNVFLAATPQSRRINNNATIKFLFILIWQRATSTIFLSDLLVMYVMIYRTANDRSQWQSMLWSTKLKHNFTFEYQTTPHYIPSTTQNSFITTANLAGEPC